MVVLVWGRRWHGRKLGYVADFCEVCRRPESFRLDEDRLIGHFWYIPLGRLHAVRHRVTCTQCRLEVPSERIRYEGVSTYTTPVRQLIPLTFPRLEHIEQARMDLERVVRRDVTALTRQQRQWLLQAPFVSLSQMVERRFSKLQVDPATAVGVLVALFVPSLLASAWSALNPGAEPLGPLAFLLCALVPIVAPAIGARRRWVRRVVVPNLRRALAPLQPKRHEVDQILKQLREHKHRLGAKLRLEDFFPPRA